MKVSAIMKRNPRTVANDDSLAQARKIMVWGGFRHLPVIEPASRKLVGVLSERDVARHQARAGNGDGNLHNDAVSMVMSATVHTASPDDSVAEVTARMVSENVGCLPVTALGELVGLVTTTDALASVVGEEMVSDVEPVVCVADVMTPDPKTAHPDDYLLDAASRLSQYQIRHLPVVDGAGHVLGVISDRDVRSCIGEPRRAIEGESTASGRPLSVAENALRVRHAMSVPPVTVTEDESCVEVARSFVNMSASAVPVVDDDNRLVGVVSYLDLLRAYTA